MNWKTRQMFSDQEHGIVSGLSPVNMTGGGNVPYPRSYQDGTSKEEAQAMQVISERDNFIEDTVPPALRKIGKASNAMLGPVASMLEKILGDTEEPSIEQQVAALAAQQGISVPEARATILNQMIQEKGLTLSEEVINQFATGLITLQDALSQAVGPPKMQAGTGLEEAMSIDLFQQGDQDINEPLNMMAQAVSPSIADITPTETVEETVTVTEDQGPSDTEAGKAPFQQMAVEVVKEATMSLAREDYMNIEQVQQDVEQQLNAIDETYRQQTGATDTILTEEFLAQLDSLMVNAGEAFENAPGMEEGTDEETATGYDINTLITSMAGKGVDPVKIQEIIKKYYPGGTGMSDEMLQNRISRARRGALLGGKTKQGGWAGMMDILGQADAAEVAAIGSMPETLATNEAALKQLAMKGELETAGGVGAGGVTADAKKMLMMQAIMGDPKMPQDMKDIFLKGLAGIKPGKEQKIDLIKSFMKDLMAKEPRDQKKIVGTKENPTAQEIATWAAKQAQAILDTLEGKTKER